eukprot:scaffold6583_cov75-Phaeocystis_antarctica.AAC.2
MRLCVVDYPPLAIAPVLFRIMFEARRELSCVMCESSPATFSCACETREGAAVSFFVTCNVSVLCSYSLWSAPTPHSQRWTP